MAARTVMIQGTGSHVGKSVMTAALCRLFARQGVRVAPFKAQNMSNNSFVTPDGKEIGRAQAVQAAAARQLPRSEFNPVLIKPSGEHEAQLVVNGQVAGKLLASEFGRLRRDCAQTVCRAFDRLASEYDVVVLEGAGSPAEINLREMDIVNMFMAAYAKAPVLLVGDIDRGGVFAALVGTMALLTKDEQAHVKGFVINKFRGDRGVLDPGIRETERRLGIPCLGVIPFARDLRLPEEDAVEWSAFSRQAAVREDRLRIGVAGVPCISNFTDFDPLASEPDVELIRVNGSETDRLDALIFPGTKHTAQALQFVKDRRIDQVARQVLGNGGTVLGICGGYQMLGRRILDPDRVESSLPSLDGLDLLDVVTSFSPAKMTVQVSGIHRASGHPIEGYEIHMGQTAGGRQVESMFEIRECSNEKKLRQEGAVSVDGRVFGTYIHGLFDAPLFRRWFLNTLRGARGWSSLDSNQEVSLDQRLDRLADFVAAHLDMNRLEAIMDRSSAR